MLFWMIVKVAFESLIANKMRSILAMLGIIIGVAAVIAMLAIGSGAQKRVMDQFNSMGTNLIMVTPAQMGVGGVTVGTRVNLKVKDAMTIVHKVDGIKNVSPSVNTRLQVKYYNQNTLTTIQGVAPTYFTSRNFVIAAGRIFRDSEADRFARVAVLGSVVAENLFGDANPVGQTVQIRGISFLVIGTLQSKGDQGWFNPDDQVMVPYTTCMRTLMGTINLGEIDVEAQDGQDIYKIQDQIQALMRHQHHLLADTPDDTNVRNQAEMLKRAADFVMTFKVLLSCVAAISLAVGGIGIMNIMLVTVTERTREIGIRKAIGARESDILSQFLYEAVVMSGVGGAMGVILGCGASKLINVYEIVPVVTIFSIVLSITVAGGVGIFFGFYPAWRASKLDPIEALRYE